MPDKAKKDTEPKRDDETDTEYDNRRLADEAVDPKELQDHDGIGGKGRMPDAQALTRPGPGDHVPDVETVVDPDKASN